MDVETAAKKFKTMLNEQPDVSPAIVALTVLYEFLENDDSKTVQGLLENIRPVVDAFMRVNSVVTSVKSASNIFLQFITLTSLDQPDFEECRKVLCERGKSFLELCSKAQKDIAKLFLPFVHNDYKILIHSYSRVVLHTLIIAHQAGKNFHVYVTESAPDNSGRVMYEKLTQAGIDCTLIIDAAVGHVMEYIDFIVLGAETVVVNGGIINKIGSYGIARIAKHHQKRVFVVAERFKIANVSPANQRHLRSELKLMDYELGPPEKAKVDYVPPDLITLLVTDLGCLPTSAVHQQLLKLYE